MRKRKTRKTQKGGGWFGTKKKPLSTAPTVNTYNYSQNTEDRASALAWLEKEEKIMNTAHSVDDAVKGLVALESERETVPETDDIPGDEILDQEISDLQEALAILKSGDNPTSILETLNSRHPKIYSSLTSIINYMGYSLQTGGGERNRGDHYSSSTNHAMMIGQGALLQQSAASGSFDSGGSVGSGGSGGAGEAVGVLAVICLVLSFFILAICVAIKTSRVLYRISKYIFKIMVINYKKRVHLQNNNDLTKFPYVEPKMQPLISRWWGKKYFGFKFLPNVGGVLKSSNARGWNLETVTAPETRYNPLFKQPAVTWQKVTEGADTWYESSDGKSAWDLPPGASLR
jgi:hypothetical protein